MQIFTKKSKGFTLIELLVVIAIIGILAAIVLVSLASARKKAKDAAIKASLTQVRTVAEMFYTDNGKYTGFNAVGQKEYEALVAGVTGQGGTLTGPFVSDEAYCIQSTLNVSGSWCVDSTGYSGTTVNCDGVAYNCE